MAGSGIRQRRSQHRQAKNAPWRGIFADIGEMFASRGKRAAEKNGGGILAATRVSANDRSAGARRGAKTRDVMTAHRWRQTTAPAKRVAAQPACAACALGGVKRSGAEES